MNRNSHNSRGSSTNAGRWRTVFIALMLALAVGTAQLPLAQAADPGLSILAQPTALRASVSYRMNPINPKKTLCFGETVTYTLNVYRELRNSPPTTLGNALAGRNLPELYMRSAVKVEATSSEPSIGTFARPGYGLTGEEFDGTNNVEFQFTAKKKRGTTNLYFEAVVNDRDGGGYVTATVPVKVIPCKFKAKTVLQFSTGFYNLAGISSDAVMIADEQGHLTGSASMSWAYSNVISGGGPCRYSMLAADSQVDLVGQLDEDGGQVMTTATFQPTTVSSTVVCLVTGTEHESATVHPLTFTVDSSGGVSTQTATAEGVQGALELEGPVSGTARVILIPEEDGAVSFIPGNYEASLDYFSSLFGSVLALR